jgi:hypothetical protein
METRYDETAREVLAIPHVNELDWAKLGRELRAGADEAHENDTPSLDIAWDFLLENPECFGYDQWPSNMPKYAPEALQRAYGMVA